jgi:hypothetical protein
MLSEQAAFGAQPLSYKCQANTAPVLLPEHCSLSLPHRHVRRSCKSPVPRLHAPGCSHKSQAHDYSNSFPEFQTVVFWVITPYSLLGGYQHI